MPSRGAQRQLPDTQLELTETGAVLRYLHDRPGWFIKVDVHWQTWSAGDSKDVPPPGARRDDPALAHRIHRTAGVSRKAPQLGVARFCSTS